jgi:hypothetical protein
MNVTREGWIRLFVNLVVVAAVLFAIDFLFKEIQR